MLSFNTIIAWIINDYLEMGNIIITILLLPLGHISNTGRVPGTIGRGVRPQGSHGLWEEINQPLVGWNKFPLRPRRFEKEKTQRGKMESYSK